MRQTILKLFGPGALRHSLVKFSRATIGWPPNPPTFPEKSAFLANFGRQHGIKNLIETGTFAGDMVEAQRGNFGKIVTIELDEKLCAAARTRFANHGHVTVLQGDSGIKLPEAISLVDGPVLFWLDAHYSGGVTAVGDASVPVLKELSLIAKRGESRDVILIDDARLFGWDVGYPDLASVRKFVEQQWPARSFKVESDIICIIPKP